MSIFKTIALAAVAIGITGSASAANYNYPAMVNHIVTGSIFNIQMTDDQRLGSGHYIVGFSGAFNRQCGVLDQAMSARLESELNAYGRTVLQDVDNGRTVDQRSARVVEGFQDGQKFVAEHGCRASQSVSATQTLRRVFQGVR